MSTTGKEYKLAIRIAGIIDKSFTTSLTAVNSALRSKIKAIDSDFTKLDKGFDKIMNAGKKCFSAIATAAGVATVAIGAATAASIKVGSEFESAFAGVKKTVDATEEEYAQLRQDIIDMTREIPSSASDIAGVMEIAGQLGIANESLTDFTETMINLGVATNLSADDAATNLARFANIMTMDNYGADGVSNFERLGSTIVDLGNNFATTESEIVDMAEQLAAAGKLAGMSEADIIGIAAAMSSVGLSSEVGASSMSRLIMQMQEAVSAGGGELAKYASTAGMSSDQFASLFRSNPSESLIAFIEGLNAAGEDSYGILDELELSTIRTRRAFLSLAGADDLMRSAIELGNEAWDENTALAIEAGKRYETAESKVQILKNAFSELGIVAYDDLREPYVGAVEDITDKVNNLTDYVDKSGIISKVIKNISKEIPTMQRKIKSAWKEVSPFFEGLMGIGKWFLQNPEVITGALVGIGSALTVYKIASNLSHVVQAIMAFGGLNPVTQGILIFAAALGIVAGAISAYKQHEKKLIDDNLAAHFGNITLSMEELQEVAEYIISSNKLGAVKEALAAYDDLEPIASTMEDAVEEINKMNWKVSIGMELTEDEQESYKQAIDDYITAAQDYALQSQYAVSLNLSVAFDENDLENSNVVDKVNQFYSDKYTELSSLGTQLNDTVTEAFNDGLLDIDEAKEIAEIQSQMAAIAEALATGEFDAKLSMLQMEYAGGGSLTAESFKNLQAELDEQVAAATETYKEAYTKSYAAIQAAYDAGDYLTEQEYQSALDGIQEEFLQNVSELQIKSINFQLETIMNQYSDELDPAIQNYIQSIQDTLQSYTEGGELNWLNNPVLNWDSMIEDVAESSTLDSTTKSAISSLLTAMEPTMEDMESLLQQYKDLGMDIPDAMLEGISNFDLLNALTAEDGGIFGSFSSEDLSSVATVIGEQMVSSGYYDSFYQGVMDQLSDLEYYIPDEVVDGVTTESARLAAEEVNAAAEGAVEPAVQGMYAWSQEAIDEYYSKGFTANANVDITLNPRYTNLSSLSSSLMGNLSSVFNVGHRANGGLATRPELTWFAENSPEMAIPIDGSQNAISLWEQTGRLLGMDSALDGLNLEGGSSSTTIEYSPTLQFYGEAPSKTDLEDALRVSQDEFEEMMDRYIKTHGRVSFG